VQAQIAKEDPARGEGYLCTRKDRRQRLRDLFLPGRGVDTAQEVHGSDSLVEVDLVIAGRQHHHHMRFMPVRVPGSIPRLVRKFVSRAAHQDEDLPPVGIIRWINLRRGGRAVNVLARDLWTRSEQHRFQLVSQLVDPGPARSRPGGYARDPAATRRWHARECLATEASVRCFRLQDDLMLHASHGVRPSQARCNLVLPRSRPATVRTDEDTVALVRRLAVHYPDTVIAGNR